MSWTRHDSDSTKPTKTDIAITWPTGGRIKQNKKQTDQNEKHDHARLTRTNKSNKIISNLHQKVCLNFPYLS